HVERDPLREAEVRTSVVAHEELTTNDELGGADGTVLARAGDIAYFGVRKRRGVELDRRFELVVEHEERCHFVHGSVSSVKAMLFSAQPLSYGFTVNRLNDHPPELGSRRGEA